MGYYLFAVIPDAVNKKFKDVELDGEKCKVITVPYKDMAAVAAKAPIKIYEPSRKNAKAHQDAVSNIMKEHTVIPVSFGNIVESEKDVEIFMKQLYPNFKIIFPKIANKFEVGLKLVGKKKWMQEQAQNNPKLKQMQQSIEDKSKASSYYDRLAIGEASKDFVGAIHLQFEKEVFQPLAKIANAAKSNEVVNERMLLNAAFLLEKDKEEEFDLKVNEIYEKWKDHIDFTYTGPWPAYNFIDLKVKAGAT
ncbi:GvpL/GvpF family gas vesicle protein [Alkalicoccus daliensis]|uniref:Gas vesicle synthesis protein GvpL/GvpF n=1 Tax=Alkalicoccus daliensis TaxID=745820 RepID=A0A1H0DTR1_9BACI|nr:GvpL/GvpF family gas vesicle protein [Alkalicoccus daliensis]SDN73515.1 Gas vesicle synthesis protein GvpL/GvpF [Alkalicoccus daliensis]